MERFWYFSLIKSIIVYYKILVFSFQREGRGGGVMGNTFHKRVPSFSFGMTRVYEQCGTVNRRKPPSPEMF